MRNVLVCLAATVLSAAAPCRGDPPVAPPTPAAPVTPASAAEAYKADNGPLAAESIEKIVLHDAKRGKDLDVAVTYPKGDGPFPVIVFSHGAGGTGSAYNPLIRFWATHGYVVLAPTHADSLSRQGEKDGPENGMPGVIDRALRDPSGWENRARDISFLIDSFDRIQDVAPALKGKMDAKRLGVGGHSYGALTTQLVAGATVIRPGDEKPESLADPRPVAFLVLSGQGVAQMGLHEHSWDAIARPMMVMTGSLDRGATGKGPEWKLEPFKYAPPPDKYGVLVQDATHMSFLGRLAADGGTQSQGFWTLLRTFSARGTDQKAVFRHVRIATIAFWDAYLKGDAKAKSYLQSDALPTYSKGAVRLERK